MDEKTAEMKKLKEEMDDISVQFNKDLEKAMVKISKDFKVPNLTLKEVVLTFLSKFKK